MSFERNYMYQVLKQYCESEEKNGLLLMDMPTGSGKTYNVLKYIYDACQCEENKDRRYFFITPLKKNLPLDELKHFFERERKLTLFNEKVIFINSTADDVIEGYKNNEKGIKFPEEIQKTDEYKTFVQQIELIIRANNSNDYALKRSIAAIDNIFRTETEPKFRKKASDFFKNQYKSRNDRLIAIKTDDKWKWVGFLYPAAFTREKQIIFMSMDKFLAKNVTFVEPSYYFYANSIIENSIIFVDEFDSTKKTVLDNIISNGLRDKIDYLGLFKKIYSAMETKKFPTELTISSNERKTSEYKDQPLETVLENTHKKAKEIHDIYTLQFNHRTDRNLRDTHRNFLFQDHQFYTILDGKKKYITTTSDSRSRINIIGFSDNAPSHNNQNIHKMLGSLRGFIEWFQKTVNILAINYCHQRNERRSEGDDEITHEQAVKSVLELFSLDSYEISYLTSQILISSRKSRDVRIADSKFDLSVYERGFRYYCFENDPNHDMKSDIMMCSFQNSPEKLLIRICERAKVIGISATATIPSVIGNYDLDYLKLKMQGAFHSISNEDHLRLHQTFEKSQCGYKNENVRIHTELLGCDEYSVDVWSDIFDDRELALYTYNLLERRVCDEYNKKRYFRITSAYKRFITHDDIGSMLCLLTKFPGKNDVKLDESVLIEVLNLVTGIHPNNKNKYIRILKGEDYDNNKDVVLKELSNGNRLFVISTYQTIGAGQNLQYSIPEILKGKLITSNDYSPNDEKDFDAIYLDKPTNLLPSMENNWPEESFVKYLFDVEFLQENSEISVDVASKHIKAAFKCYMNGVRNYDSPSKLSNINSLRLYATTIIIQAIGRICRTNQKNNNIYIYADHNIADCIDVSVIDNRIFNYEFRALVDKFRDLCSSSTNQYQISNKADCVSNRVMRYIDNHLNNGWSEKKISEWEDLRHISLLNPTVSKEKADNNIVFHNFYILQKQKNNELYYSQDSDFRRVKVSYQRTSGTQNVLNSSNARLDMLMRWDALKEYFISQGYATTFVPNDYIMSPPLWNNIYKGALGEVAGYFWFSNVLNIILDKITDPETFELFDYKVPDSFIYVDFKNWSESTDFEWDETITKIETKAVMCTCKCAIIANIIGSDTKRIQRVNRNGMEILLVPALLFDKKDIIVNQDAINCIMRCINEYTNKD